MNTWFSNFTLTDLLITNQWAFWFIGPAVLFVIVYFFRLPRRVISILLRLLCLCLLALAAADLVQVSRSTEERLLALFDVSASVTDKGKEAFAEKLLNYLQSEGKDSKFISVLPFASDSATTPLTIEAGVSTSSFLRTLTSAEKQLDRGDSDLGSAIAKALAEQAAGTILLLSDGYETKGDALAAAESAQQKGAKIFPLIPDQAPFLEDSFSIAQLHAPLIVYVGEKVPVRIALKNSLSQSQSGEVELWLAGKKLTSQRLTVSPHSEKLLQLEVPEVKEGLHKIQAVLRRSGKDQVEKMRWVTAKERSKIILVSGSEGDEFVIKRLLELKGYSIETIIAGGSKPIPTDFSKYSNIVLNNIARTNLPNDFLSSLKKFVDGGGGALLVGGDRAFGLGGYINTPLEEISPLKFVPPQTQKKRLSKAIVLVIDKSRSMVFQDKIVSAKKAAITAIDELKDDDYVGVIGFDSTPFVIIRTTRVSEVRSIAERRLRNLTAAGRTDLLPALAAARQGLRGIDAGRKHIIVLSDGKVPVMGGLFEEELKTIRQQGITLSAVALGIEADVPFMQNLAQNGAGAFYHTLDPNKLPQIFLHDIKVSTGEKTLKEQGEYAVNIGPGGLRSVTIDRYPPLKGFVETLPKKGSQLELITRQGEKLFPIFASWVYGKGKVFAFTSDTNGRWSTNWLRWDLFASFWTQVLESLKSGQQQKPNDIDFDLRHQVNRKQLFLDLTVYDDTLVTKQAPLVTATVIQPHGEVKELSFAPSAKGRFSAVLDNARPGDYRLNFHYGDAALPAVAISLDGSSFGEQAGNGINVQNLSNLAFVSGGSINPSPDSIAGAETVKETRTEWYPKLLPIALLLLVLEIFFREQGAAIFGSFVRLVGLGRNRASSQGIYQAKKTLRA